MRRVLFETDALDHLETWGTTNRKTFQRIFKLLAECQRTPFDGIGKPEPLKGDLKGLWSRRITDEHRLVYQVTDATIVIHSLRGHYEE